MLGSFLDKSPLLAAVLVILCLLAPGLQAQTTYGSIVGTVRDASSATVPGVKVIVTNESTNVGATAVTNDLGAYAFTTLVPGPYRLRAETAAFVLLILPAFSCRSTRRSGMTSLCKSDRSLSK